MYDKAIKDIDKFSYELYCSIREHEFTKALDEDMEFKRIHEMNFKLYDTVKVISKISDNFKFDDPISSDPIINQIGDFHNNYRQLEELMEYKMYLRGIADGLRLLKKIGF